MNYRALRVGDVVRIKLRGSSYYDQTGLVVFTKEKKGPPILVRLPLITNPYYESELHLVQNGLERILEEV